MICNATVEQKIADVCSQKFMWPCRNTSDICIHESLVRQINTIRIDVLAYYSYLCRSLQVCDGYAQCPDSSDEDDSICLVCPRAFGFSASGRIRDATRRCRHRYNSSRHVCAVPCDGVDDMCLDDEDETDCSRVSALYIGFAAVSIVLILVSVVLNKLRRAQDSESKGDHLPMETLSRQSGHEELTSVLVDLLGRRKPTHEAQKLFRSCHERRDLSALMWGLKSRNLSRDEEAVAIGLIHKLECNEHKGDSLELEKCVWDQLGTTEQTTAYFDAVEPGITSWAWSHVPFWAKCYLEAEAFRRAKVVVKLVLKVAVYYSDTVKDLLIISAVARVSSDAAAAPGQQLGFASIVLATLICTFVLAELANLVYVICQWDEPVLSGMSLPRKLAMCAAFPLLPAIIFFQLAAIELCLLRMTRDGQGQGEGVVVNVVEKAKRLHESKLHWNRLLRSFKRNENVIEQPVQVGFLYACVIFHTDHKLVIRMP